MMGRSGEMEKWWKEWRDGEVVEGVWRKREIKRSGDGKKREGGDVKRR
jgi:hypothetical protein